MKKIDKVLVPERRPFHKVITSIACTYAPTEDEIALGVIKAGTLLKRGDDSVESIMNDPEKGVAVAKVDDVTKISGVLAHDVDVSEGKETYNVGVVTDGVVYKDVMIEANESNNYTEAVIKALTAHGIKTYNVKTK